MPTDPVFDTEVIDIYHRSTQLRERLLPYVAGMDAHAYPRNVGQLLIRP